MTGDERDVDTRVQFLGDRLKQLILLDEYDDRARQLAVLMADISIAFHKTERRGERRGIIKGTALAKLSEEEKNALGFF